MVNHQATSIIGIGPDLVPVSTALDRQEELFGCPFSVGPCGHRSIITVDRLSVGRGEKLAASQRENAAGIPWWFPGRNRTETQTTSVQERRLLASAQTGAAIVPVTINGSGALLPAALGDYGQVQIEVTEASRYRRGLRPGNLRLLSEQFVRELPSICVRAAPRNFTVPRI